jgi:hypothetical protein
MVCTPELLNVICCVYDPGRGIAVKKAAAKLHMQRGGHDSPPTGGGLRNRMPKGRTGDAKAFSGCPSLNRPNDCLGLRAVPYAGHIARQSTSRAQAVHQGDVIENSDSHRAAEGGDFGCVKICIERADEIGLACDRRP